MIELRALLAGAILAGLALAASAIEVPRWQPRDFAFKAGTRATNPFTVGFSAEVKGPDGKSFTLPGF